MYLFDTNIFDYILKESISIDNIQSKGTVYITKVQMSEIKNLPDLEKRKNLLNIIEKLNPIILPLESGIWLDSLYWDDSEVWNEEIGSSYVKLLGNSSGYGDALSGEVAEINQLILVTNDHRFIIKAQREGIPVLKAEEFFNS